MEGITGVVRGPGPRLLLRRALRLRCPRCGRAPLFGGWLRMHQACAACGLRYEREPGYFVGAIYVNYALTIGVAGGAAIGLDGVVGLSLGQQLTVAVTLATLVPVALFRHARSIWLAIEFGVTSADERLERRRRGVGGVRRGSDVPS